MGEVGSIFDPCANSLLCCGRTMAFLLARAQFEHGRVPQTLLLPWERGGFLGMVMGTGLPIASPFLRGPEVPFRLEPAAAVTEPAVTPLCDQPPPWQMRPRCVTARIPKLRAGTPESPDEARLKALGRWRWIIESAGQNAQLFRQMSSQGPEASAQLVADTFYGKSTSTLRKRACAVLLYVEWAGGQSAFPVTEPKVYDYVSYLRAEGAPATRATSFLEAINFAVPLLGLAVAPEVTTSARVRGAALASLDRKGVTRQAPPFEVQLVEALELAVETARTAADRAVIGFALFTLYARARASDSARATGEPELDVDAEGHGYVEVRTVGLNIKIGRGKRRRLRLFPMVGPAQGLRGSQWAAQWVRARQDCDLDAQRDGCLQPTMVLGEFRAGIPMGTEELMGHVRRVLRTTGAPSELLRGKSSHSLKATCLSWCAKAGINQSARRILGGHALPKDVSVMEYSRDALAAPLRELDKVLSLIRGGSFLPDAARSGRWKAQPQEPAPSEGSGDTEGRDLLCSCGEDVFAECDSTYHGAQVAKCAVCLSPHFSYLTWPAHEQQEWDSHCPVPRVTAHPQDSDADSERSRERCASVEKDKGSEVSSSGGDTPLEEPPQNSDLEEEVTAAVACQLPGDGSSVESSDPEEVWLFPTRWKRPLVRHIAWYTVHALREDGKLLCGRARGQAHVAATGPVDDWPACRICQAWVRAMAPVEAVPDVDDNCTDNGEADATPANENSTAGSSNSEASAGSAASRSVLGDDSDDDL